MDDLTPRQRQVLRFIQDALTEHGMPPTRAEIAEALGFKSANAAEEHLRALQRKGVLDLRPGASRASSCAIRCAKQMGLPAHRPRRRRPPDPRPRRISRRTTRSTRTSSSRAALPAQGERHEHAHVGILDGDLVAVHRTPEVRNRRSSSRASRNEVTVKRYKQDGSVCGCCPRTATSSRCASISSTSR